MILRDSCLGVPNIGRQLSHYLVSIQYKIGLHQDILHGSVEINMTPVPQYNYPFKLPFKINLSILFFLDKKLLISFN